jgi:hypothetical protein
MLIVYTSASEVIVTTRKNEKSTIKEWFGAGLGRDIEDYDREEIDEAAVSVSSSMKVR